MRPVKTGAQPTPSGNRITGVILAGGPSSRFHGLPKGLQTVGGERIIDRVARALNAATDGLLVVSNDPQASGWLPGVPAAADVLPLRASAVGIHSALARAGSDVLVVAWDMPFVPAALLQEIRGHLTGGALAVVPWGPNGPEPVCAAYADRALPHVQKLVESGALKLTDMVEALPDVIRISAVEVARFGDPATMFFNVNDPAGRARAEEIAQLL